MICSVVLTCDKCLSNGRNAINYYSNKYIAFKIHIKKKQILVYSKQSYEAIYRAIQREKCELYYLKKGYDYEFAHKTAKQIECLGIDFPEELLEII